MEAKNYYGETSPTGASYETLHEEVIEACNRIEAIPCSEVSGVMQEINSGLNEVSVSVEGEWNSSLGASFASALEGSTNAINAIIGGITGSWSSSEGTYSSLLDSLNSLKTDNDNYKTLVESEPKTTDSKYNVVEFVERKNPKEGESQWTTKTTFDKDAYDADHTAWLGDVQAAETALDTLCGTIDGYVTTLQGAAFSGVSGGFYVPSTGGVPTGSLGSLYTEISDLVDENNPYEKLFETDGSRSNNMAVIWNFLRKKGLTGVQAAGVMGNIWWEADRTFDPATENSIHAYGLVQWLNDRRERLEQYASQKGVPSDNLQAQLEFLWDEGFSEKSGYRKNMASLGFFSTNSPYKAAEIFDRKFERSEDWRNGTTGRNRGRPADAIYDILGEAETITPEQAQKAIDCCNDRNL